MLPCRGDCSVLHLRLSPGRHLGLQLWQRVGPLTSGSERCVCFSVSLPLPGSSVSLPQLCLSLLGPVCLSPSLPVWLGVGPIIHLWITLHSGLQVPCLWWGWGSSVSPLYPTIRVSVLSHPWLALPHLSLSCLRLPESPFP